uniref:NACHT domain-containing protein n=1 Tax=Branchiostoma floridae TaxID=7739 RepID=C3YAT1_BRAFL|eukprot:XP_002606819.1 hypothetical protein BRAFLDRAFT_82460 [Branchiostoma floridae]
MAEGQQDSATGVRKSFFLVKEEVSSDWKDLAFHLDFRRSDTDNIESRNRDDKSRCMDLLEEWLKRNGERATIEVLMEALSEAKLQSTVDSLRNKYPDVFRKAIKKYYELKLTYFKPLVWNDNFKLTLSDIFTQLELVSIKDKQQQMSGRYIWQVQKTKINSLDDLLNHTVTGQSTASRCILIEGEAGKGKTTFLSKEAIDAVSKKTELGRLYDIVLLIRLREVREDETLEEMVWDQCVPETIEGIDVTSIRTILQKNESRVLFLLDGYDELRPGARANRQAIPKLLDGKLYPNSAIVITSRPSAGVQQYIRPDSSAHIMGFSVAQVVEYIRQYFRSEKNSERGEQLLVQHFDITPHCHLPLEFIIPRWESRIVNDLIHTPIFLFLVCVLWQENRDMVATGTMTGLYENLLTCLVRKYCVREGVDMPTDGLPTDVADTLLQFGKVALEALRRNETLLDLTQVEREKVNSELLLKLGVVSLEVSASKLHPRKQLNFSHKTMQEFLAGRYIAHALVNRDPADVLQLTSISNALQLSNLLRFTCGCDTQAAQAVLNVLCNLRSKEFPHVHAGQFKTPVKQSMRSPEETYEAFIFLCLDLLDERKERDVLLAVSKALPVIFVDINRHSKPLDNLMYYLKNILSSESQDKVILIVGINDARQGLEQSLASYLHDPRLEVRVGITSFISPEATARLVLALKNVPGLRALSLRFTSQTLSTLQQLVQGFSHMSLLEELDLSTNSNLGDDGIEILQVGLSRIPHLAVLRLGGFGVGMTGVGMSSLASYMRHLAGLRELDISHNNIGDNGLEHLATTLHTLTAMQVLVLAWTGISATGMRKLVPALCQLTRMIKLDISCNMRIGDLGLECLVDILPHLTALKELKIRGTGITGRVISALVRALPHLVELQVLDVRDNNMGDSDILSMVQTLCNCNTTLEELYIGYYDGVTGDGWGNVAQLISALPALTRLEMSGSWDPPTPLPDTAAMTLAEALPRLPALEWLNLQNISMEPAGFQAVVQAAEEHPTLEELK